MANRNSSLFVLTAYDDHHDTFPTGITKQNLHDTDYAAAPRYLRARDSDPSRLGPREP